MSTGTVIYSGLAIAKGAKFTQTRGVTPDRISVRLIPQVTPIADIGDLTLTYGALTLTIPDCLADRSMVMMGERGFTGTVIFQDRRWRWSRYPSVSYHWNEYRSDGVIVPSSKKSLRQMIERVLMSLGEPLFSAGVVDSNFYPEVDVQDMRPDLLLEQLTSDYGYAVSVGFSGDPVRIHKIGSGQMLSPYYVKIWSEQLDPPTPPATVRIGFGPSVAQARFRMSAYGREADGTIALLDDLTYTPANGWAAEPLGFPNVLAEFGEAAFDLAKASVWRLYGVTKFADNTLDLPDGSGTLANINQVLPFLPSLLFTENRDGRVSRDKPKIFGKHYKWFSPGPTNAPISEPVDIKGVFNHYQGIILFDEPVYQVLYEQFLEAELYLEAAFRIRSVINNQFFHYIKDLAVAGGGQGYHSIADHGHYAQTLVEYSNSHAVTGTITNQTALDSLATTLATAAIGNYTYLASEMRWYSRPMFGIKVDGAISQVQHVISDGDDGEPGHYTVAARHMEFDRFVRTEAERRRDLYSAIGPSGIQQSVIDGRGAKGND